MIEHYENSSSLESRICLEETQNQLIENIQESLQDLDKQTKQFSFFDLGLSDYDIKTLSKIKTLAPLVGKRLRRLLDMTTAFAHLKQ